SNLMPIPDGAINTKPGAGHYFANYENSFGFAYGSLTGSQVAQINATVDAVNAVIVGAEKIDKRIHPVCMDQLLTKYDTKHDPNASAVLVPVGGSDFRFTNVITEGQPWPLLPSFKDGGLQGLDGMHPTIVGYTLMAQNVLDAIGKYEGILVPKLDMAMSDRADTLLTDMPRLWCVVLPLWRDIRRAFIHGHPAPAHQYASHTAALMQALQFKTR
ncbi:MAG TPA: hypothetical protein VK558_05465, partial [Patescibacteria group bacterium]|nr:hypothetical protein [Patescibacteria group bacterium]